LRKPSDGARTARSERANVCLVETIPDTALYTALLRKGARKIDRKELTQVGSAILPLTKAF
jgi:hypothetical protein